MYIVTVNFTIDPVQWNAFLPLMFENARTSRETEIGCHQFDVSVDPARQDVVFLYEVYDDRAAFDAHLASAHFLTFKQATASMITAREVGNWTRAAP